MKGPDGSPVVWPTGPLIAAAMRRSTEPTMTAVAATLGVSNRTVSRWIEAGYVSDETADVMATRLGLHPANIWCDWHAVEFAMPTRPRRDGVRLAA